MTIFNKLKTVTQKSKQALNKAIKNYILFTPETKQLVLTKKTVLLFCQQAVNRVEKLKSLEPELSEGLIATVEHKEIEVKIHFTPEKIFIRENLVEGQLRLLKQPQFQTDSIVYRYLIAGWKIFLGGKIPNGALPENIKIEGDLVYYSFPKNQLQLLEVLFSSLQDNSALITRLKQGELAIETSVALNWNDLKLQSLLKLLNRESK